MKGGESNLDGCGQFLKYSIFAVNLILFLGGLVVVGLGIWVLVDGPRDATSKILDSDTGMAPAIILLVFGAAVAFISFLGCCGAVKEVKCLLMTFFIIVLIITILFITGAALLYKYKDQFKDDIISELKKSMKNYDSDQDTKKAWDYVQENLKCCGAKGYEDWIDVPSSCICSNGDDCSLSSYRRYWKDGCVTKIEDYVKKISVPLFGVAIAIIVIMVLSLVFTCSLFLMI